MKMRLFQRENLETNNHKNLATIILWFAKNAGLWVENKRIHWLANIATSCFIITYIFQLIALGLANNDPERLFECFSVLSFCGMGILKLHSLRRNANRWCSLLTQVSTLEKQLLNNKSQLEHESDDSYINFSEHITKYTNRFQKISNLLPKIYGATLAVFIISPFVEYLWHYLSDIPTKGYPHILPVWEAVDKSIFGYLALVSIEVVAAIYCVLVHITFDLTTVGLMIFVCGQFNLLRHYSENIGGNGDDFTVSDARNARAHFRIIKCHRVHVLLVSVITELEKLIQDILGIYYLVAMLTLCSVAIRLKTEELSVMKLVPLLQYMGATLTQLFLLCHYGDGVWNESSLKMGEGPFVAAFWCLSPRIRREISLLAIGMLRPRRLRAGPFHYLDLPSFVQIVRTAYSYYAVIGQKS